MDASCLVVPTEKIMSSSEVKRASWITEQFQEAFTIWCAGVQDALAVHRCVYFLARSKAIRVRALQCFLLNGVIFLGSIVLFNWALEPALCVLRSIIQDDEFFGTWATDFIGVSVSLMYKILWIYPIYCISFILNTVMYQDIADSAFSMLQQKKPKETPPLARLIEEAYRVMVTLAYIVEMDLLYLVPMVGPALYFVHSCWLASVYCFEYRWVHDRWSSNARVDHFERHWLYFSGFGFPVSFVSFWCPQFIDTGVFALLFPLCVLTATTAKPQALQRSPRQLRRVPIFFVVQHASCYLLRVVERRCAAKPVIPKGQKACSIQKR